MYAWELMVGMCTIRPCKIVPASFCHYCLPNNDMPTFDGCCRFAERVYIAFASNK